MGSTLIPAGIARTLWTVLLILQGALAIATLALSTGRPWLALGPTGGAFLAAGMLASPRKRRIAWTCIVVAFALAIVTLWYAAT